MIGKNGALYCFLIQFEIKAARRIMGDKTPPPKFPVEDSAILDKKERQMARASQWAAYFEYRQKHPFWVDPDLDAAGNAFYGYTPTSSDEDSRQGSDGGLNIEPVSRNTDEYDGAIGISSGIISGEVLVTSDSVGGGRQNDIGRSDNLSDNYKGEGSQDLFASQDYQVEDHLVRSTFGETAPNDSIEFVSSPVLVRVISETPPSGSDLDGSGSVVFGTDPNVGVVGDSLSLGGRNLGGPSVAGTLPQSLNESMESSIDSQNSMIAALNEQFDEFEGNVSLTESEEADYDRFYSSLMSIKK